MLTAHGSLGSAQEAIRLGICDYLTKPCHLGDLERAIGRVRHQVGQPGGHIADSDETGESKLSEHVEQHADQERRNAHADEFALADLERRTILDALNACGGNKTETARVLGISRRTLYNRLSEYETGCSE